MSAKQDDYIDFQALKLEEGDDTGNAPTFEEKLSAHLKFLKENMEPEKYTAAVKALGLKADLSNEELLEQFRTLLTQLLEGKKEGDDDDDDDNDMDMMSYKDFMKECMKGEGKTVEDCAAEWKKKYPEAEEPSKEAIAEIAALAKKKKDDDDYPEPDKKMKEVIDQLTSKVQELENKITQKEQTAEVEAKVDTLIEAGHLAPSQKEGMIKLASGMNVEQGEALLNFFRTTQKIGAFDDKGHLQNSPPGSHKPEEIPEERREAIMDRHGILNIIQQRGSKRSKEKVNN